MVRRLALVLVLVALTPQLPAATAVPSIATPDDVVRGFIAALPTGNYGALAPFMDYVPGQIFSGIDTMFEKYACIDVRGSRFTVARIDANHAIADIRLDGVRAKANGTTEPLPNLVVLLEGSDGGWTVTDCYTAEEWTARQMFDVSSDEERQCLLERSGVDPAAVIRAAADYCSYVGTAPHADPLMAFCIAWSRAHDDVLTESDCYRQRSLQMVFVGDNAGGVASADLAIMLAREGDGADELAHGLFQRAFAEWSSRDIGAAEDDMESAAQLLPKVRDTHVALKALYMKVYIETTEGQYRAALMDGERLRRRAVADGWTQGVFLADWEIGDIHTALRNFTVSVDYHRRVYAWFARNGDPNDAARALADLAFDEMNLGALDAAHAMFARAYAQLLGDKYLISEFVRLLTLAHRYGELETLLDRIGPNFAADDGSVTSQILLGNATVLYAKKRYADAARAARLSIAGTVVGGTVRWLPWPAQTLLGQALLKLHRDGDAEVAFRDAITIIEHESEFLPHDEMSRLAYFGDKIEPYRALAEVLARRGDGAEAVAVAESVRARALDEVLKQGKVDVRRDLTQYERDREQELSTRVSDLNRKLLAAPGTDAGRVRGEIERARAALVDFQAQLGVRHAALRTTIQPRTNDVAAAASRLAPGELVVEYMVGPERTIAFLITRQGTAARFLPVTQQTLERLAQRFATAVEKRDLRWQRASREIYDAVIAPLQPELSRHRDICVIPDGALWRVPFEALLDRHGDVLIDHATIAYAPSLLVLGDTRRTHPKRDLPELLAFGNPAIAGTAAARVRSIERGATLGALPEAADEVTRIGAMYGRRSEVFVGQMARESTLKADAARFRIIHIAAHGFVEDRSPLYSCIVLVPDQDDDGLLEMREVVDLKLNADLVVLSSCDTARGKIAPGEGVVGLAWAFLAAGCPSTVVSQWKVDSAATEQLMVDFHRRLLARGLRGKAEALRRAKLALRHDPRYRHPYYWAPFVVVGDGM